MNYSLRLRPPRVLATNKPHTTAQVSPTPANTSTGNADWPPFAASTWSKYHAPARTGTKDNETIQRILECLQSLISLFGRDTLDRLRTLIRYALTITTAMPTARIAKSWDPRYMRTPPNERRMMAKASKPYCLRVALRTGFIDIPLQGRSEA